MVVTSLQVTGMGLVAGVEVVGGRRGTVLVIQVPWHKKITQNPICYAPMSIQCM